MLNTVSLEDVLSNVSDSPKWVVNESGTFEEVSKDTIPIDHHPDGSVKGFLVESEAENTFPDPIALSSGITYGEGTERLEAVAAYSMLMLSHVVRVNPQGMEECFFEHSLESPATWKYIGLSFFIKFIDGQEPKFGRRYIEDSNFTVTFNQEEVMDGGSNMEIEGPFNDGSYWARMRIRVPRSPIFTIQIGVGYRQRKSEFVVGGIQIERDKYSSFMPYKGKRSGNYVRGVIPRNNLMNPQQGTIEVVYKARGGSVGCILTVHDQSYEEKMEVGYMGTQSEENTPYVIKLHTPHTRSKGFSLIPDDLKNSLMTNQIIYTYSPYGIRLAHNGIGVLKYKDTNFMYNRPFPNIFTFGLSEDGSYADAHIQEFYIYGRAYRDDELIDFTPNPPPNEPRGVDFSIEGIVGAAIAKED